MRGQGLATPKDNRPGSARSFAEAWKEDRALGTAVAVRPLARRVDGWSVAETANFRIWHNQEPGLVWTVAQAAEKNRASTSQKWFGAAGEEWRPRCDLYLHATGAAYSRATGVPSGAPGHSTTRCAGSRVLSRRIDLHCDEGDFLLTVLAHEVTHVVMPGRFGDRTVPPWANEGMAVLAEPRDRVERHLQALPRYRREGRLLTARRLLQLHDYPDPGDLGVFYGQSVSLVNFLASQKGPQTFTRFVRHGLYHGYEEALRRYYGLDFEELEQQWQP